MRGFSLVELMVVVAVIGVSGSLAMFAMSDQVSEARAKSDQIGMYMRIKAERDRSRERMRGLIVDAEESGRVIVFRRATRTPSGCVDDGVIARANFGSARLDLPNGPACLDERGIPVGTFALSIGSLGRADLTQTLVVSTAGVFESTLDSKTGIDTSGTTNKNPLPLPPI